MPRRDFYREQKYGVPQLPALPARLPKKQFEQKKMADEKFIKWTPKTTPAPVTVGERFVPTFSSLTAHERECGFSADEVTYKGLVVRRLLYRGVPVFYAALGHCCASLDLLRKEVNRD